MGRRLGLTASLAYAIGGMIGTGIFIAPMSVLLHTGSVGLSLCLWPAGAIFSAVGALVYIELGTHIPESGGGFAYLTFAQWNWAAISFFWLGTLFTYPMMLAIQTRAFVAIAILNLFPIKTVAARFQITATGVKLAVVLGFITVGIVTLCQKGVSNTALSDPFVNSTFSASEVVLALYASLFSYSGWEILNTTLAEFDNPNFILPLTTLGSIAIGCIICLGMNIAYFSALTADEFAHSSAVAVMFADRTMGPVKRAVPLIIALLLLGNLNTTVFGSSRYMWAGAVKKALPKSLSCAHPVHRIPRPTIILQILLATGWSAIGSLDRLIGFMSFAELLDRVCVICALLFMRHRNVVFPNKGFRNPVFVPLLFILMCLALLIIPLIRDYTVGIFGVVFSAVSILLYGFIYKSGLKFEFLHNADNKVSHFLCENFNLEEFQNEKRQKSDTIFEEEITEEPTRL